MVRGEIEGSERELSFPKLMIGKTSGVIVLMFEHGVGTVVHVGDSGYVIGQRIQYWDMRNFKDYTGSVTITNEED